MKTGRVLFLVSIVLIMCALGVTLQVTTGTHVVAVADFGANELLPTPTPQPKYRIFINLTSKKIHVEGCYHTDGADSKNVVEITEEAFHLQMFEGASICSNCEKELSYLVH